MKQDILAAANEPATGKPQNYHHGKQHLRQSDELAFL